MCAYWFDSIFRICINLYDEIEDEYNFLYEEHINQYLQCI